ncbi:hypothetical protein EYF80_029381 [Liparis tanakae]|uniref:Uncharacterized protein n=1 Tax=Liparis tanakae TaxID=230148 RepID=A0A4Z2H689_9TELE|nr:hypothetical protein EYF80_029381 [Liparis tanakae]
MPPPVQTASWFQQVSNLQRLDRGSCCVTVSVSRRLLVIVVLSPEEEWTTKRLHVTDANAGEQRVLLQSDVAH